ncbi:hypothetical protein ACHAWC_011186 [Mediolabrus comicus]
MACENGVLKTKFLSRKSMEVEELADATEIKLPSNFISWKKLAELIKQSSTLKKLVCLVPDAAMLSYSLTWQMHF